MKFPSVSLTVTDSCPVSLFVILTLTPATTAPEESVTVPNTVAVFRWATRTLVNSMNAPSQKAAVGRPKPEWIKVVMGPQFGPTITHQEVSRNQRTEL